MFGILFKESAYCRLIKDVNIYKTWHILSVEEGNAEETKNILGYFGGKLS